MGRFWVGVLLVSVPSLCWAQSLAEVAEKEKKRRKQQEEAGVKTHIVTEDDLKKAHDRNAAAPASPSPSASPDLVEPARRTLQKQASAEADRAARTALWKKWNPLLSAARQRVSDTQWIHAQFDGYYRFLLAGQGQLLQIVEPQRYPAVFHVDANGKLVGPSLKELPALVARAQADRDAAKKAWDALVEAALKEHVPQDWLLPKP
jgi:hypothetical protein